MRGCSYHPRGKIGLPAIAGMLFLLVLGCRLNLPTPDELKDETTGLAPSSSAKAITSFSFDRSIAPATIDEDARTIMVIVRDDAGVLLVPTFTTTGSSVKVGSIEQISGMTRNNFEGPVIYTVTAADGSTTIYTVTVLKQWQSGMAITAFSFPDFGAIGWMNHHNGTIEVTVPHGTDLSGLVATFTTTGTSVKVGATVQVSGVTANNFGNAYLPYTVVGPLSSRDYTVRVRIALPLRSKAITEFSFNSPFITQGTIDENAKTIAVTMPYATDLTALVANFKTTGSSVRIGSTVQVSGSTANNFSSPVAYTVAAADGSTAEYTTTVTREPPSSIAIVSFHFGDLNIGPAQIDQSARTIYNEVPTATVLTALRAAFIATPGTTVRVGSAVQTSGITVNDFSSPVVYAVMAPDGYSVSYTVTVKAALPPSSSSKAITLFHIGNIAPIGTVDEQAKTIQLKVQPGTNVTSLVARFLTTGVSVKVGSVPQQTGVTANNFINPVVYTVTAADSSTTSYMVTVKPEPVIYGFQFANLDLATVSIDRNAKTIGVSVPHGTDVSSLVAIFYTTGSSAVTVGSVPQVSGVTSNNFSDSLDYKLTAFDNSTAIYAVTVSVRPEGSEKAITRFELVVSYDYFEPGVMSFEGTIDENARKIVVSLGWFLSQATIYEQAAIIHTTGLSVKVGSAEYPVSDGIASVPFSPGVIHVVTARDGSTAAYSVWWEYSSLALVTTPGLENL